MEENKKIYDLLLKLRQSLVLCELFKDIPELNNKNISAIKTIKKQLIPLKKDSKNYIYLKKIVNKLAQKPVNGKIIYI